MSHRKLREQVDVLDKSYKASIEELSATFGEKLDALDKSHEASMQDLSATFSKVENHNDSVSAHQGISQNLNELLIRIEKLQAQLDSNLSVVDKLGLEFRRSNEQRSIADRDIKESFKEHERVRDETETLVDQRLSGLEERLSSYADTYVKDSDLSPKAWGAVA